MMHRTMDIPLNVINSNIILYVEKSVKKNQIVVDYFSF